MSAISAAKGQNFVNAGSVADQANPVILLEARLQAAVDAFASPPSPADVTTEATRIARATQGMLAKSLNRLLIKAGNPTPVGAPSTIVLPGGGGNTMGIIGLTD